MQTEDRPSLSLCMIVRDEADGLEACIDSVRDLVDEVVIVDTGSTDGTWGLVQTLAHRHAQIPWEDHFSLARNHALDLVTGDFVLILDGDERLIEGHDQIRAALRQRGFMGGELRIENQLPGGEVGEFWACRLFIKRPDVRWRGRIHEQVLPDLQAAIHANPGSTFRRIDATIRHVGYLPEIFDRKSKAERNVRLLTRAVEDLPDGAPLAERVYLEYKLATALGAGPVGQNHLLRAAHRVLVAPLDEIRECAVAAEVLVSGSQLWRAGGAVQQALQAAERAEALAPGHPMPQLVLGNAHLAAGSIADAGKAAQRAGECDGPGFHYNRPEFERALAVLRATVLDRQGDQAEALTVLVDLTENQPDCGLAALVHLQFAARLGDPADAVKIGIAYMKRHGTTGQALEACAVAAERAGQTSKAAKWRGLAARQAD